MSKLIQSYPVVDDIKYTLNEEINSCEDCPFIDFDNKKQEYYCMANNDLPIPDIFVIADFCKLPEYYPWETKDEN